MGILRRLIESHPFFERVPRPDLIEDNTRLATGDAEGNWALVYAPGGGQISVKVELLKPAWNARWFCPRTGNFFPCQQNGDVFSAPDARDWVLELAPA